MVDVEPDKAAALIELIGMLIEEWYVSRFERAERLRGVKELAIAKKAQRNVRPPQNS
jgi:hypothetical protein